MISISQNCSLLNFKLEQVTKVNEGVALIESAMYLDASLSLVFCLCLKLMVCRVESGGILALHVGYRVAFLPGQGSLHPMVLYLPERLPQLRALWEALETHDFLAAQLRGSFRSNNSSSKHP